MGRLLVVGYGNDLAGDDAVGRLIAERLEADSELRGAHVLSRRQLTPELALDASQADTLVLIDASTDQEPGAIAVRALEPSGERASAWSHHMTPEALVALARELYGAGPSAYLVSVGVASVELGGGLSEAVEAAIPKAVRAVERIAAGIADA